MKTEEQVLNYLSDLFVYGNAIISASIGNGGTGLDISINDIAEDLKYMDFNGQVEACEELKKCQVICNDNESICYQWSDDNGYKVQVLVW